MNCEIAKDLMPLYVEDICSSETRESLEEHLKNCSDCTTMMERYKKDLEKAKIELKNIEENDKSLQPMKKVKRKLWYRKYIILFLTLLLLAVFGSISVLTYGEITNAVPGFTTITDAVKLKRVCEKLTQGDTQAFMDILPFTYGDMWAVQHASSFEDEEAYKENVKNVMEEAYEYHFKGKDIRVEIGDISQYSFDQVCYVNERPTLYEIHFYENDEKIYTMEFREIAMDKFLPYETAGDLEPRFVAHMLPVDDLNMDICLTYAIKNQYRKFLQGEEVFFGAGLSLLVKKEGTEEEAAAYAEQIRKKVEQLYNDGWFLKEGMHALDGFDEEVGRWKYKVWLLFENQEDGSCCLCEYHFHYYNDSLYVISNEDATPQVVGDKELPEEVKEQLQSLFLN